MMALLKNFASRQDLLGIVVRVGSIRENKAAAFTGRFDPYNPVVEHVRQNTVLLGSDIFQVAE